MKSKIENVEGNSRLTALVGFILLGLFLGELFTLSSLRTLLPLHIFLGLLLIPPLLLKLSSVLWRFFHYYLKNEAYNRAGAPALIARLLGPLLAATTVVLLGSGVMMVVNIDRAQALNIHRSSYPPWLFFIALHVAIHLKKMVFKGSADYRPSEEKVKGKRPRLFISVCSILVGVVLSLATLPAQRTLINWAHAERGFNPNH